MPPRPTSSTRIAPFPQITFTSPSPPLDSFTGSPPATDFRLSEGKYFGLEGGYEMADNERCEEVLGGDEACFPLKRNFYVGVRGGTRLGAQAMAYLGAAYVNGKGRLRYEDPAFPADNFSGSDDRDGWRLSAGVEHRLGGNFFGKLEYRYANYSNYAVESGTERLALGFQRHQVVAGLGARF